MNGHGIRIVTGVEGERLYVERCAGNVASHVAESQVPKWLDIS